jgi:hypothetical protein
MFQESFRIPADEIKLMLGALLMIVHPRDDLVDCGCFVHAHEIARHDSIHPQGLHALACELTFSFPTSHSSKNPAGQLTPSSRR